MVLSLKCKAIMDKKYLFQIAEQQLKHETKIAPGVKESTIWEIYQIKRPDIGNGKIRNS